MVDNGFHCFGRLQEKYLEFVKGLKKLWIIKVTVVPVVIISTRNGSEEQRKEAGNQIKIQTTALLKTIRILRRLLE